MALMIKLLETKPSSFREAIEKHVLVDAMVDEYKYIVNNSFWEVILRPTDKSVVGLRWIFMVKHATNGSIEKYKASFLAKVYSQVEGIEYEETFSPIALYSSIRSILALAT